MGDFLYSMSGIYEETGFYDLIDSVGFATAEAVFMVVSAALFLGICWLFSFLMCKFKRKRGTLFYEESKTQKIMRAIGYVLLLLTFFFSVHFSITIIETANMRNLTPEEVQSSLSFGGIPLAILLLPFLIVFPGFNGLFFIHSTYEKQAKTAKVTRIMTRLAASLSVIGLPVLFFFVAPFAENHPLYQIKEDFIQFIYGVVAFFILFVILCGIAGNKSSGRNKYRNQREEDYYDDRLRQEEQRREEEMKEEEKKKNSYHSGGLENYCSIRGLGSVDLSSTGAINYIGGKKCVYGSYSGRLESIGGEKVYYNNDGSVYSIGNRRVHYGSSGDIYAVDDE